MHAVQNSSSPGAPRPITTFTDGTGVPDAPGSGGAVRPETGETSDNLIPIIDGFDFLSEEDKLTIFNTNPLKVVPQFARVAN